MTKLLALQFGQITTPGGYQPGGDIGSSTSAIEKLISNVLVVLTVVAGISFVLYFLLGGIILFFYIGAKKGVHIFQGE